MCTLARGDDAPRDPDPRRRHRSRADGGDPPRPRSDRCRIRLGRARGRRRRHGVGRARRFPRRRSPRCSENKVALKGPITTPIGTGFRSVNVALRHELGLYACLRPCKTYPGVRSRYDNVDSSSCARTPKTSTPASSTRPGTPDAETRDRRAQRAADEADRLRLRDLGEADQPRGLRADHPLRVRVRAARTAASACRASRRRTS